MARVVLPTKTGLANRAATAKNGRMRTNERDTGGDSALLSEYANYLRVERGLRPLSCEAYRGDLLLLAEFLEGCGTTLLHARSEDVQGCLKHLREHGMESRTVARKLSCWRGFYRWLLKDGRTKRDPLVNLESPSSWVVLPKSVAETDVAAMLDRLAAGTRLGGAGKAPALALRDHALLELLYAGGLRVGEVVVLRVEDLQTAKGQVQVRGKGDKERLVPAGRARDGGTGAVSRGGTRKPAAGAEQGTLRERRGGRNDVPFSARPAADKPGGVADRTQARR